MYKEYKQNQQKKFKRLRLETVALLTLSLFTFMTCLSPLSAHSETDDEHFLVSKEGERRAVLNVGQRETYHCKTVFRSDEKVARGSTAFIITAEKFRVGDSFVSVPSPLDIKIRETLQSNNITSLDGYTSWLKKNVVYQPEASDSWSSAQTTMENKYGDCEDFAFLNAAVLRIFGYEPEVMAVIGRVAGKNHAICIFKQDNEFCWFDNTRLNRTDASSKEALYQHLCKFYYCTAILKIDITDYNDYRVSYMSIK